MDDSGILIDFIINDLIDGQTFRRRCLNYAQSRFGIRSDNAEDLYQELCLRALSKSKNYTPEKGNPQEYLIEGYRNLCRTYAWNRHRKKENLDSSLFEKKSFLENIEPIDGRLSPQDQMIHQEEIQKLRKTITKLKKRNQELLTERYFEGKRYNEIAQERRLNKEAIESRVYYSIKKLKKLLSKSD